ncbi:TAXI family TRAP transporter solute-binding subunit [Methylocystis sp. IM2]|uniref:TAXI family TRAP transporter solute-binding subunit n=1 Tax=Methylocystis sp. IM2 TaxID=3136563 RepID=UPI0030FC67F1
MLEVRQTQGALENARLVTDAGSDVDAAFIQAGLIDPQAAANVRSLGSLNYAPVWLFFRGSDNNGKLQKFMELGQRRIAIGPAESGSYAAAMRLLALNKQPVSRNLVVMPLAEAVAAINRNDLDAVLLVDGVDSEIIRALVRNPDLQLANFARAAAYARAVSHWQALTVPMGGLDLARNFPLRIPISSRRRPILSSRRPSTRPFRCSFWRRRKLSTEGRPFSRSATNSLRSKTTTSRKARKQRSSTKMASRS